jgi:hypothetical protein
MFESIPQAKTHEEILKLSKGCDNGSFGFDQVNPAEEVQQRRPLARSCMFGRGYLVRSCDGVEAEVVATGPPRAILLGPHVQGAVAYPGGMHRMHVHPPYPPCASPPPWPCAPPPLHSLKGWL